MPVPEPSVEELLAVLKRSALPTILVEGSSDAALVYRCIERQCTIPQVSVLPCGGRNMLLELFRRRGEFGPKAVAFLADQDLYVFTSPPAELAEVIWTKGYSIENDIYEGSDIERLLEKDEVPVHQDLLRKVVHWFACEVEAGLSGHASRFDLHVNQIIPLGKMEIAEELQRKIQARPVAKDLLQRIETQYSLLLRGKQLIQCLARVLTAPGRRPTHSAQGIIDMCVKLGSSPNLRRIVDEVGARLRALALRGC